MNDASNWILVLLVVFTLLAAGLLVIGYLARRSRLMRRIGVRANDYHDPGVRGGIESDGSALTRWLYLAGFRQPNATSMFLGVQVCFLIVGLGLAAITTLTGLFTMLIEGLELIPGDFAQVMIPLLQVGPWLPGLLTVALPWLYVTRCRREVVNDIERELPVMLELLATLAEAGLGFDSAVARLLESDQGTGRLAEEFRTFQRESLSGVPRVRCLRRLSERVDVPTFSTFISSLIQAEKGGFGLSNVLRHQSDDLRNRRKENALMRAQALPVKLVFPLVVCFLPGLFVLTLGPAFYTFFQVADRVQSTIR